MVEWTYSRAPVAICILGILGILNCNIASIFASVVEQPKASFCNPLGTTNEGRNTSQLSINCGVVRQGRVKIVGGEELVESWLRTSV